MSMGRISTVVLVLFLQIAVVFSPYGFVLCVHEDGRRMIEPVWATCCRDVGEGSQRCADGPSEQTAIHENQSQEDSCKDYPLTL